MLMLFLVGLIMSKKNTTPRSGPVFILMQRTRASFKLASRYCRQHEAQCRADTCARSLEGKDPVKFWKSVHRICNSKATKYVTTVGNVTDDTAIADMWMNHYQQLCNTLPHNYSSVFYNRLHEQAAYNVPIISVADVYNALSKQKRVNQQVQMISLWKSCFMQDLDLLYTLLLAFNLFLSHDLQLHL